jgi:hypothetical protein
MAGLVGVNGVYEKLGMGNTKGSLVGPGGIWRQVLSKLMLTYGKGGTR